MLGILEVERLFGEVREIYFPFWDVTHEWKVVFEPHANEPAATGYCDSKTRTIFLSEKMLAMTRDGAIALLVHEICHDVGAEGHDLDWAMAIENAAKIADLNGNPEVGRLLRTEIFAYCGNEVFLSAVGRKYVRSNFE